MHKKQYAVDDVISAHDIGDGYRYPLLKSGSFPTHKTGTILSLMDSFLHQQESTIRHIRSDIEALSQKGTIREKSYKIGAYKIDIINPNQLVWFDKEIYDYFNSLPGYSVTLDLDKSMTAGISYPVWIKISR